MRPAPLSVDVEGAVGSDGMPLTTYAPDRDVVLDATRSEADVGGGLSWARLSADSADKSPMECRECRETMYAKGDGATASSTPLHQPAPHLLRRRLRLGRLGDRRVFPDVVSVCVRAV